MEVTGMFALKKVGLSVLFQDQSDRNTIFSWLWTLLKESTGIRSFFLELGWLRKSGMCLVLRCRLFLERAKTCSCFSPRKMPHSDSRLLNWWHWQLMRRWYHSFKCGSQEEKRVILRAMRYKTSGTTLPLPRAKLTTVRKNPSEYISSRPWAKPALGLAG